MGVELSEHYSCGRKYSFISNAWILQESWNDREEIAALNNDLTLRKEELRQARTTLADHEAALAEKDLIIAKACKSLHDSSRALLDELDRVRADFQKREQHLLVMYGYLWQ